METVVLQPTWDDLTGLVISANDLLIVTPFYSEAGIERVIDNISTRARVRIATRLSPADWAANVADPEALHAFLDLLEERGALTIVRRLHAKVYIADDTLAIIGSGNLTSGGFGANIEMAVRLVGGAAAEARRTAVAIADSGRSVTVGELHDWIEVSRPAIVAARSVQSDAARELEPSQRELDRLLGFGAATRALPQPSRADEERFIDWLRANLTLAGAEMIVRRHDNSDGQNLQGHVNQSFASASRFFTEKPALQADVVRALDSLKPGDVYQLDGEMSDAWNEHVDGHALDEGEGWSYPILRSLMPPSLGGTRLNGGGGSSTLKRMLPLVAKYLGDQP